MTRGIESLRALIAAAFDQAATHTDDPAEISRRARELIRSILERADQSRSLLKN